MLEVVALAAQVAAVLVRVVAVAPREVTAGAILKTVTIKPQIGVVEVRQITLVTPVL